MPAAAASDHASTRRSPSRNGPVPRRQTTTPRTPAPASGRAQTHQVRVIPAPDLLACAAEAAARAGPCSVPVCVLGYARRGVPGSPGRARSARGAATTAVTGRPRPGRGRPRLTSATIRAGCVRRCSAARRNRCRSPGSASQRRSAAARAAGSSGGTSKPGSAAVAGTTERAGQAADICRDDREPARERLGDDHPVRLGAGRQHEGVGSRIGPVQVGAGAGTAEPHPVADPAVAGLAGEPADVGRITRQAADAGRGATAGPRRSRGPRAARRAPCRASRAATQRSRPPAVVPGASSARSTPGSATCTCPGGSR